jgi:phosphoribosylglycinamide formyltransferase-1
MGKTTTRIAIFASGTGTNADKIMAHFSAIPGIEVALVLSNRPNAGVLQYAAQYQVPTLVFDRHTFYQSETILQELQRLEIDWIVLAGFLWLVPANLIDAFPQRIINIHPALLPDFGGKGMYGMRVHEAVVAAGKEQTGITIHYVNNRYDEGATIFQATCVVDPSDTPDDIATKVHKLEHRYFPIVLEKLIRQSEYDPKKN